MLEHFLYLNFGIFDVLSYILEYCSHYQTPCIRNKKKNYESTKLNNDKLLLRNKAFKLHRTIGYNILKPFCVKSGIFLNPASLVQQLTLYKELGVK